MLLIAVLPHVAALNRETALLPAAQPPTASNPTICMYDNDKGATASAPSLFLLGGVKCSSTSFAKTLRDAGVKMMSLYGSTVQTGEKEWRFFDSYCGTHATGIMCDGLTVDSAVRSEYVRAVEYDCDEPGTVSDASPTNMYLVGLPQVLADLYQSSVSRLSFVFLLREPLARMQSDFYFYFEGLPKGTIGPFGTTVFAKFVEELEANLPDNYTALKDQGNLVGADFNVAARSFYGMKLKPWLEDPTYKSTQFSVLPSGWATLHAREAVDELQKQFTALRLNSSDVDLEPTHLMANNPHPPLEEDLDQATRTRLRRKYFMPDTEDLSDMLMQSMARGLHLGGFDRSHGVSSAAIQTHLQQWWNL
jgi:hypothetical protein